MTNIMINLEFKQVNCENECCPIIPRYIVIAQHVIIKIAEYYLEDDNFAVELPRNGNRSFSQKQLCFGVFQIHLFLYY